MTTATVTTKKMGFKATLMTKSMGELRNIAVGNGVEVTVAEACTSQEEMVKVIVAARRHSANVRGHASRKAAKEALTQPLTFKPFENVTL